MTVDPLRSLTRLEADLWEAADQLRANSKLTSSEYCMPVLGVIFLRQMLEQNPLRMDYYRKYQEIVAAYNREKDRATVEQTFAELFALAPSLDAEQRRAVEEGLSQSELALFDLLTREDLSQADRERLKQASRELLTALQELLRPLEQWTRKAETQAEVEIFILDRVWQAVPQPPYSEEDTRVAARRIYDFVWQRSVSSPDAWGSLAA